MMAEWSNAAVLPEGSFGKTVDCYRSRGSAKHPSENPFLSAKRLFWPFFMYYNYILKSLKDNGYYYGHSKYLQARLVKHNGCKVRSTKSRVPFIIHYIETFETKSEAYQQEMFFKNSAGKFYLRAKGII